jgi:hypothetical protein
LRGLQSCFRGVDLRQRKALNAVAQELLKSETIQYSAAKNIIEEIISAQNSALQKVKKGYQGLHDIRN